MPRLLPALLAACIYFTIAHAAPLQPTHRRHASIARPRLTLYGPFFVSPDAPQNRRTRAALHSWAELVGQANMLLFTEQDTSCDWLPTVGLDRVRCDTTCTHATLPRLDMGCITETGARLATTPHLAFVNSDIVLLPNFVHAVAAVAAQVRGEFVVMGRRTNIPATQVPDTLPVDWPFNLLRLPANLDGACAIDYFVHSRRLWTHITMPPFVTGVWQWDRMWSSQANVHDGIVTVDATRAVTAFHLQSEAGAGDNIDHAARPYADYNAGLVAKSNMSSLIDEGSTNKTDLTLLPSGQLVLNKCSFRNRQAGRGRGCLPVETRCGIEYVQ